MLDTLPRPLGVQANFGAMDRTGHGAYYETDDNGYRKATKSNTGPRPRAMKFWTEDVSRCFHSSILPEAERLRPTRADVHARVGTACKISADRMKRIILAVMMCANVVIKFSRVLPEM